MKREDARLFKKKKQEARAELSRTLEDLRQRDADREAARDRQREAERKECEEGIQESKDRDAAKKAQLAEFQKKAQFNQDIYVATAGRTNHEKEVRETRRVDKDERE